MENTVETVFNVQANPNGEVIYQTTQPTEVRHNTEAQQTDASIEREKENLKSGQVMVTKRTQGAALSSERDFEGSTLSKL